MTRETKPTAPKVAARRPIAEWLISKMRGYVGAKNVILRELVTNRICNPFSPAALNSSPSGRGIGRWD